MMNPQKRWPGNWVRNLLQSGKREIETNGPDMLPGVDLADETLRVTPPALIAGLDRVDPLLGTRSSEELEPVLTENKAMRSRARNARALNLLGVRQPLREQSCSGRRVSANADPTTEELHLETSQPSKLRTGAPLIVGTWPSNSHIALME